MSEKTKRIESEDISLFHAEVIITIYMVAGGLIAIGMAWMNSF